MKGLFAGVTGLAIFTVLVLFGKSASGAVEKAGYRIRWTVGQTLHEDLLQVDQLAADYLVSFARGQAASVVPASLCLKLSGLPESSRRSKIGCPVAIRIHGVAKCRDQACIPVGSVYAGRSPAG